MVEKGYDVLNMSYGAPEECFAESAELQRATGAGVLLVAAAGNEFAEGNPLEYPASLPHVVTVAAVDLEGRTSYFSNANAAVDLAAPGERVATAVPLSHDPDGDGNGYALLDGTSFAAPIVAGAAAWVAAARPNLTRGPAGERGEAVGDRPRPRGLGPEHGLRPAAGRESAAARMRRRTTRSSRTRTSSG